MEADNSTLSTILFFLVVLILPIWLFLRYSLAKHRLSLKAVHDLDDGIEKEFRRMQTLQNNVEKLEKRIRVLETILDSQRPRS